MTKLSHDLRYAARALIKNPGFTAIAVFTLALGIGANTAIFSVVHASLLRPLPYPQQEEVLIFWETNPNFGSMSISYPNYRDWRREVKALEELAVYRRDQFNLTGAGDPEQVRATMVSENLFDALGVEPMLGRGFSREEDSVGGAPVAVLHEGYWQRRFGGDRDVLASSINLNGQPYEIVGVAPSSVRHPTRTDLFVPIGQFSGNETWQERGNHPGIYGIGRLADGVTLSEAQAEIESISRALAAQYPDTNTGNSVEYRILPDYFVSDVRPALILLSGAVALVLLIACVNVANLLLVRATGRERELAIRAAVGAGRGQIARQLLTESLLLAALGGIVGVVLAFLGIDALRFIYGESLPRVEEVAINLPVLGFTVLVSLATGLLFGIAPALQGAGRRTVNPLRAGARTGQSVEHRRFQTGLVVAEIALAIVLLVGAGLLLRSFAKVLDVDPGLDPEGVITAGISLPEERYDSEEKVLQFWNAALDRVGSLPGVSRVGVTNNLPFVGGNQTSFSIAGRPEPAHGEYPFAEYASVSHGYFDAIGMSLIRGRLFDDRDHPEAPDVMVIDEAFAATHWPGEDPIGKEVVFGGAHDEEQERATVVGIVGTVRHNGLDVEPPRPQMYFPIAQRPEGDDVTLVIKSGTPPATLTEPIRQAVLAVDPDQPVAEIQPFRAIIDESLENRRLSMSLFGFFAAVAVVLAVVGIYGVVSYGVARRTQELGVRIALGASAVNVLLLVLRQVGRLALVGVLAGAAGALLLVPYMKSQLFCVSAYDPLTFVLVSSVVFAFALSACLLPARRASRIQPTEALRYE